MRNRNTEIDDGFKMTEIGPLPEEWEVVSLKEVSRVRGGYSFPRKYQGKSQGRYPFYKVSDMNSSGNEVSMKLANNYINDDILNALRIKLFPKDTIIFPKVGGAVHTNKKRILSIDSSIDNNIMGVTVTSTDECLPMFLLSYFQTINLSNLSNPGPLPSITNRTVKDTKIPLPPLSEQKKIAAVLSAVQEAKEKTENVIEATKGLKKSLMKHLFTYGSVSVDEAENVPLKETEIGMVPEEWNVAPIEQVGEILMGQSPPGDSYNTNSVGIPLINGPAEFGKSFPKPVKWTTHVTKVCKTEDILFCVRGNTTGRMNIADDKYCIGRGVAAIRGRNGKSETNYLFYFLAKESKNILALASAGGSTFPNITKSQLNSLSIPYPLLPIQQRISEILSAVDRKIEVEENKKKALEELFKSLLNNLMTGKIRVKDMEIV